MSAPAASTSPATASLLVRAMRREPVERTPVWFMRQAGRSLPEYRAVRAGIGMLDACARPDLVTEITLQPVRRHGVDAAILFSDIMVPLKAAGVDLDITAGVGPVVAAPVRTAADVAALPELDRAQVGYVEQAVRMLVRELAGTPLIGFAGAPFTLASYLIEGGPSREHARTKAFMHGAPGLWSALLAKLAATAATFLRVQVEAGATAVQLFDSWAGTLSVADYREFAAPYSARVLDAVDVPTIHFATGDAHLLEDRAAAGGDVIGVDWRLPLDVAWERIGHDRGIQGNLDGAALLGPWERAEAGARDVLERAAGRPGHVFNLGHGVLPETDPDLLGRLVRLVHQKTMVAA